MEGRGSADGASKEFPERMEGLCRGLGIASVSATVEEGASKEFPE